MSVQAILFRYGISRQDILKAALLVRDQEQIGSIKSLEDDLNFQRSRKPGRDQLDRAIDILRHLPDCPQRQEILIAYAYGQMRPGRPMSEVGRFWGRVPDDAIIGMASIAARVLL